MIKKALIYLTLLMTGFQANASEELVICSLTDQIKDQKQYIVFDPSKGSVIIQRRQSEISANVKLNVAFDKNTLSISASWTDSSVGSSIATVGSVEPGKPFSSSYTKVKEISKNEESHNWHPDDMLKSTVLNCAHRNGSDPLKTLVYYDMCEIYEEGPLDAIDTACVESLEQACKLSDKSVSTEDKLNCVEANSWE